MREVHVELSKTGKVITVRWSPSLPARLRAHYRGKTKSIAGAQYRKSNGGYWVVPRDLVTCHALRDRFGDNLVIGRQLKAWARKTIDDERNLRSIATADTATLTLLPQVLPALYAAIHTGPRGRWMTAEERAECVANEPASFQAADVQFMATTEGPLNANHMGLGKTLEAIAAVFEEGTDNGPQLVVAQRSTLETVWGDELRKWQPHPVLVATGTRRQRERTLEEAERFAGAGEPFWLVVNPEMVSLAKDKTNQARDWIMPLKNKAARARDVCKCKASSSRHYHYASRYPAIHRIVWEHFILDEAHKTPVGDPSSVGFNSFARVKTMKRYVLTGTPIGGVPLKLFGILAFLNPREFSSRWRWMNQWITMEDNGFGSRPMNEVKRCHAHARDLTVPRPMAGECSDCDAIEEAFYRSLTPYVLRRRKGDVLDWLPPKQIVPLWVDLSSGEQMRQYTNFEAEAEVRIGSNRVLGRSVLDEYTRLKQFATCAWDEDMNPTPTGGKVEALLDLLTDLGADTDRSVQVVVFSQFTRIIHMLEEWLAGKGFHVGTITGKVGDKDRRRLQRQFQEGNLQVMLMNIKAGGVGINLDRADTVIFMDETWNPDDQEQGEDRCHRASRIHQVTCYYLRTRDTIEEDVYDAVTGKSAINQAVLDGRARLAG